MLWLIYCSNSLFANRKRLAVTGISILGSIYHARVNKGSLEEFLTLGRSLINVCAETRARSLIHSIFQRHKGQLQRISLVVNREDQGFDRLRCETMGMLPPVLASSVWK